MRYSVLIIFILNLIVYSDCFSQEGKAECLCTKNDFVSEEYPDTVYNFSNKKSLYICGYKEIKNKKKIYSEFVIGECGADTVFNFWGALKNCTIKRFGDTLFVRELEYLPTGKKFATQQVSWKINRIYYVNQLPVLKSSFNSFIRKYSKQEIDSVLVEYEIDHGITANKLMITLKKLFIASISGNEIAKKYFEEAKEKLNENSEASELYDELKEMLVCSERK